MDVTIRKIKTREFEFDCRVAGDTENEAILLLHGFPETSVMWKAVMEKLSSTGYYCVAPNLRGYSENACPKGKKHYTTKRLVSDVFQLADALGKETFHLIGHDWGAIIGWYTVYQDPDRIISWTALSVPHPRGFGKAIKMDKIQKKKSRYIGWFLIPILPELMLRLNNFEKFRRLWKYSSREEVDDYLTVFKRKYALTASLNFYRANLGKGKRQHIGDISSPTLFIWGRKDLAVGAMAANNNHAYMKGPIPFLM
ncbi:MAG: alpha/beta fold hydrolase [Bacteroidota bacterium]